MSQPGLLDYSSTTYLLVLCVHETRVTKFCSFNMRRGSSSSREKHDSMSRAPPRTPVQTETKKQSGPKSKNIGLLSLLAGYKRTAANTHGTVTAFRRWGGVFGQNPLSRGFLWGPWLPLARPAISHVSSACVPQCRANLSPRQSISNVLNFAWESCQC